MNEQTHHHAKATERSTDTQSVDPVCGMRVDAESAHRYTFQGREFHFCSERCRERFIAAPMQYIKKADAEPSPQTTSLPTHDHSRHVKENEASVMPERVDAPPAGTGKEESGPAIMYTCRMHPRSGGPSRAIVRSAGWRSSRRCQPWRKRGTPSSKTLRDASGGRSP